MNLLTVGQVLEQSHGSIKTGPFGTKLAASEYAEAGVPVISVGEIGPGNLMVSSRTKRVGSDVTNRMPEYRLQPGDIVFARKGAVDRSAWVRKSEAGYFLGSDGLRLRFGQGVDSRFMAYQLRSDQSRAWLLQHAVGTTLASLNEGTLKSVPVRIPPIDTQRAIAATLGALDDKIESNRRACDALHRLVNLHFKQTVECHVVDSIPLGEVATIIKGRSYKGSELQESATALVTLKSFDRNGGYRQDGLKPYIGRFRPEQVINPGELVVAQTDLTQGAEVVGRGVRVPPVSEFSLLVASLDLAIVRPHPPMPVEYLFGLLSSEAFRQHCRSRVTGTTVLHLAKDAMPTWAAPVVPFEEQLEFAGKARVLLERMDALNNESVRLAGVRDALLPGLLSGRIHMPNGGSSIAESSSALVGSRGT